MGLGKAKKGKEATKILKPTHLRKSTRATYFLFVTRAICRTSSITLHTAFSVYRTCQEFWSLIAQHAALRLENVDLQHNGSFSRICVANWHCQCKYPTCVRNNGILVGLQLFCSSPTRGIARPARCAPGLRTNQSCQTQNCRKARRCFHYHGTLTSRSKRSFGHGSHYY